MNIFIKIKEFFSKIFNKQKSLDIPQEENNIVNEQKKEFEERLKVTNIQNNKKTVIETLVCEGDGTGIQKIKNY